MKTNVVLLLLGLVVLALGAPKVKDVREESALKGEMSTDEDLQPSATFKRPYYNPTYSQYPSYGYPQYPQYYDQYNNRQAYNPTYYSPTYQPQYYYPSKSFSFGAPSDWLTLRYNSSGKIAAKTWTVYSLHNI